MKERNASSHAAPLKKVKAANNSDHKSSHPTNNSDRDETDVKGKAKTSSTNASAMGPTKRADHPTRERSATATRSTKELTAESTATREHPVLLACDKLILNIPVSAIDLHSIVERAQQLVKVGRLVRSTSKSRFYKHNFKLNFVGGGMAFLSMTPLKQNMKSLMQLTFNPNTSHMTVDDARTLKEIIKALLSINAREACSNMTVARIDVCADSSHRIDDLLIELDRALVGSKVWVTTESGGGMQTVYVGSKESAHHGIAYDQTASDEYKAQVGEVVRRTQMRSDAELVLEKHSGRLRVESRRSFEGGATLAQLRNIANIFGRYHIYEVRERKGVKVTLQFLAYVDCVRLRGLNGARRWLKEHASGERAAAAEIADLENQLQLMAVDWWHPQDFNESLLDILKKSPAWPFLWIMQTQP